MPFPELVFRAAETHRAHFAADEVQLCFLAGANSIFIGDRLLTTANPKLDTDSQLFADLGLKPMTVPA